MYSVKKKLSIYFNFKLFGKRLMYQLVQDPK